MILVTLIYILDVVLSAISMIGTFAILGFIFVFFRRFVWDKLYVTLAERPVRCGKYIVEKDCHLGKKGDVIVVTHTSWDKTTWVTLANGEKIKGNSLGQEVRALCKRNQKVKTVWLMIPLVFFMTLDMMTPTKETAITMLKGYGVEQIVTHPRVQALAGKSVDVLEKQLNDFLEGKEVQSPEQAQEAAQEAPQQKAKSTTANDIKQMADSVEAITEGVGALTEAVNKQ